MFGGEVLPSVLTDPLHGYTFAPLRPLDESLEAIHAQMPLTPRTRANITRALATIDPAAHAAFLARHRDRLQSFDPLGPLKYADLPYWACRNVLMAQWLGLDTCAPQDILDIGMGSGSFIMVARSMGHKAIGTDVADPWYDELCVLAKAERVIAPVERDAPYRPVARRFDLITIMLPVFHRRRIGGTRQYWSTEDWRAFLQTVSTDLLRPGGRLFILMPLDVGADGTLAYSPLLAWAEARGARLDRTFPGVPVRHILFEQADPAVFA